MPELLIVCEPLAGDRLAFYVEGERCTDFGFIVDLCTHVIHEANKYRPQISEDKRTIVVDGHLYARVGE